MAKRNNTLWRDRKHWIFGLPWSFTVYELTDDRLYVTTGVFNKHEEEIRLYRILDVSLNRSFEERIFGLGTVHVCSADKSMPEFDLKRIRNASTVKDMLSDIADQARDKKRVVSREVFHDDGGIDDDDHHLM